MFFGVAVSGCDCGGGGLIDARPRLAIDKEAIDFGEVLVGGQRVASFQLENTGLSVLEIASFTIEGSAEIAFATPVPASLQPDQAIDFNVVFEPKDVGEEHSTITITANDSEDARTISLVGIGVEAGVGVEHPGETCGSDPNSMSFGQVVPGMRAERTITVRASGSATVNILSAIVEPGSSGEWSIQEITSPVQLAPGESFDLTAAYAPEDGGADVGAFVITTDAPDGTLRVAACGEGVAPAVCARPNPLNLGATPVGGSLSGTLTIESCGLEPVTISSLALSSDPRFPSAPGFTLNGVPSFPRTMAPGETFDLAVDFIAQQLGIAEAYVHVASTALGNEDAFFPVSARGAQPCDLVIAPTSLTYANVAVGQVVSKNVLVANNGATACTISRLEIGLGAPPFAISAAPTVPFDILPGQSEVVAIDYAPVQATMPDVGRLDVDNAGVTTSVDLTGNPLTEDGCFVEVTPSFLNFGAVEPGTARAMAVEVRNISDEPCFIRGVAIGAGSSPDFIETAPNLAVMFPGATRQVSVTYTPTAPGSATGTLEIDTNDALTGLFRVPLFATAASTGICVEPRHLPFGPTPGTSTMNFTIYACGAVDLTINALDWTTPDTEMSLVSPPSLPFTLASGDNRAITVQYTSSDAQGDTAVVTVRSDDAVQPEIDVTVTGGPEIVPPSAGRFLYYWQIPNISGGDIMQLPLQGVRTPQPFWGPRVGKQCAGCHTVSPDGKYVAVVEGPGLKIVDTSNNVAISPSTLMGTSYFTWRPDPNTNPPYQYAYDDGSNIKIGALFAGELRTLVGADDPNYYELMPTWGSDGRIAFARGTQVSNGQAMGSSFGFMGATDIYVVDEVGGSPQLVVGNNGGANYYPQFSPNGSWIAYTYSAAAAGTIAATDAVLKLASSTGTNVILDLPNANSAPGDGASSFPNWAVDGTFISFASNRAGGAGDWDLYISSIDPATGADGAATPLTDANTSAFEHGAQWSP
jgi:hypothetical protein